MTNRQKEIYNVLVDYIAKNGYSPSVRELGELIHCNSSSTVHGHLKALEASGYIKRMGVRAIKIMERDTSD